MSKRQQATALPHFVNLAESLKLQRYRLGIVCGAISSGKSKIAQTASAQLQARYIDLATDLLPQTVMPGFFPTLGAYGPDSLIEWILDQANRTGVYTLVIDQIEPLLTTFGREQTRQFFRMAGQVELKNPTILVTYLKKQLEEAEFPFERLLHL